MSIGDNRAVVITGASTGIGAACALHLDRLGFAVFAGVRKSEDGVGPSKNQVLIGWCRWSSM